MSRIVRLAPRSAMSRVVFASIAAVMAVVIGIFFYKGSTPVSAQSVRGSRFSEPTIAVQGAKERGEEVTLIGRGWRAGQAVVISVNEGRGGQTSTLSAVADRSGFFSIDAKLPEPPKAKSVKRVAGKYETKELPGDYTITATGIDGQTAEAQFSSDSEENDGDRLLEQEGFWMQRLTYPTGRFEPQWVRDAVLQDESVQRAIPAGAKRSFSDLNKHTGFLGLLGNSPMVLDPNGFTPLGPSPERMTGCSGCYDYGTTAGRVNAIAVDPTTTTPGSITAYIATVGGGVWKTTTCCSSTTSWTSTMDSALISSTSVDTVVIDPNDHNTIYAGTGDLNFGSFSMGSQGVLKSTDGGANWSVLGISVFGAPLPQPAGQFPQYQAIGKVRVDPNNSSKVVAGTKTGLYFSYDGGTNWTGPCIPDAFPALRHDITGLELSNMGGGVTRILAAVGTRGFATPVQYNLDQNGANGLYKGTMPASGCPSDFSLISRNDNGFNFGTLEVAATYSAGQNMNAGSGTNYGGLGTGNQLGRMDIAVAPSNPNVIYAQVGSIAANASSGCGSAAGCQLGVWASTDGGATWSYMTGSAGTSLKACATTGTASSTPGSGDYSQNWYDQGMAVDPNNPDRVFIDTFDTWLATRTGTAFYDTTCGYNGTSLGNHVVHVDHHALAFVPGSSSVLLEGSDGGIFSTGNADAATPELARPTWVNMDTGLNTIEFYSGDISGSFATSATPSAAGGAQDNGPSVVLFSGSPTGAVQWQMGTGGDGFFARIDPVGTGTSLRYWLGNNSGGLSRCTSNCTNGGATWTSRRGAWTGDTQSFVLPFEIFHGDTTNPANDCGAAGATTGCGHLIAGTVRVWETLTGATGTNTWYVNSPANLTKQTLGNRSYINQLAFEPKSQNTAMVGTNDGNVQIGFNMGGGSNTSTWVNVTGSNAVLPNRPILDVAFDPTTTTDPVAYAAVGGFNENTPTTPGHIFRVTCNTNCASFTWENKTGNLPNIPVDSIIANPNYPRQVFAGTDIGLYFTDDITAVNPTWYRFAAGVPSVMIWDMQVDRGNTTLALFTRGRGAFAWPLPLGPFTTTIAATTSATASYGGTVTLTATLKSEGTPVAGKVVTFQINGTTVGTATTDANGVATLSGVSVAGLNAGSYPAAITVSFAGDGGFGGSNSTGNLTVNPAGSTTTVNCPSSVPYTGSPRTPCSASYTTTDGLSSSLTVNYSNNTAVGTATASATYAGDINHATSNDSKTFQILASTAADVSVSGRVMNSAGFGLRGVRVSITAPDGTVVTTTTNSFGYYVFAEVRSGRTYLLDANARGYTFAGRAVNVVDTLNGVDLVAN